MRGKLKRVMATVLSFVVIFSMINSLITESVLALSGNQDIGVIFAYGGNHGDLVLQGGWHKGASNNRFAVWYTKADRKVMYCLEPGRGRSNDSDATSRDVNYIRNGLSNRFLNGYQIERFIGYIMAYGYTGTIDGGQEVRFLGRFDNPITESGGSSTTQLYEACQILIWETVVGERDSNFNYVAPDSGYSPCKAIHTTNGDTGDVFNQYYQTISDAVKNYGNIPSYMAPSMHDADLMEPLKPNSDGVFVLSNPGYTNIWDWSLSVVDRNGNNIWGARINRYDNVVEVTLPNGVNEAYISGRDRFFGDGVVAWSSDGSWGTDSPTQDLVQCGFADPVSGYRRLAVASGSIEIQKDSDYDMVSGFRFNLYFRGNVDADSQLLERSTEYSAVTDSNGIASFTGLPFGWYEIEEETPLYTTLTVTADRYDEVTGNALVYISEDGNSSITVDAFNSVSAVICVNKTDLITGEYIGFTSFNLYRDYDGDGVLSTYEEQSAICVRDDDGDGRINFEGIGVGAYLLREAEASGDYMLSDEVVSIVVRSPQKYEVDYANDVLGSVRLYKVDEEDYEEILTDAVFEVYRDVNNNRDYDLGIDELIGELRDYNEDGEYVLYNLSRGSYVLFETVAPEDHELNPNVYDFEITLQNLNVIVGNCSEGVFTNGDTIYGTRFMCTDDEDNRNVEYGETVTLYDHVMYENVIPGNVYELELIIMDKDTNEPLLDEDGNVISVNYRFVPEEVTGIARVPVTLDTTLLMGKTIVAYETMYREGRRVGFHADIESESQTLYVPFISTSATSDDGVSKIVVQSENTVLVDTVNFSNLQTNREYRIVGVVMDRNTGTVYREAEASEVVFTPLEEEGIVEVRFTINTVGFVGNLVVFEELYDVSTGTLIAVHRDITSEYQTVAVRAVPTNTATPVPGTPRTGETSTETVKLAVSGISLVAVSVIILLRYFKGFRKEDN